MQLQRILKAVVLCICIGFSSLKSQNSAEIKEFVASGEVDAEYLATVADSFRIPHVIFYGLAWQETRHGDINYKFPRGPGREVVDSIIARMSVDNGWAHKYSHRVCREIGRFQLSPCVNWAKILKDPVCIVNNLLSKDRYFAYQVNVHCAAEHLAQLHSYYDWSESIRHYNGDGPQSYLYLKGVKEYIGEFCIKLYQVV